MKLTPVETEKLMEAVGIHPHSREAVGGLIGDACELLTAKVVIRLKARRDELRAQMGSVSTQAGPHAVPKLVAQINLLGQLLVELAEAP